jgi:hypothetical protein
VSHVDALKIDVEGYEDRVLTGFFKQAPPSLWPRAVVIEHLSRNEWLDDCIADMLGRGYAESGKTRSNTLLVRQWLARGNITATAPLMRQRVAGKNEMPIDPQEDPPIKPGQPTEPPQESPPGNPRPEVPPPMRDPGEPPWPEELPGKMPDELPVRGPERPRTPYPTDAGIADLPGSESGLNPWTADMRQGKMWNYALKGWSECAMNKGAIGHSDVRNKNKSAFEGRHNPA